MKRLLILLAALWLTPASAAIVAGKITGGQVLQDGGTFVQITDLDTLVIGKNNFDDNNLYAFNERQNVVSDSIIRTDVGRHIKAKEMVASHYIAFDPIRSSVEGWIEFDAPIIGIATSTDFLDASDFLMNGSVTYQNPAARGLEGRDQISIGGALGQIVYLSLWASSPGDFIRVFTEKSQLAVEMKISEATVPLPSAVALFAVGVCAVGLTRRR